MDETDLSAKADISGSQSRELWTTWEGGKAFSETLTNFCGLGAKVFSSPELTGNNFGSCVLRSSRSIYYFEDILS